MNILKYALLLLVLVCAIPTGFLLAKTTREELKDGRRTFKAIIFISLLVAAAVLLIPLSTDSMVFMITSMIFLAIIAGISLKKSYS
jgi:hypothetical protein